MLKLDKITKDYIVGGETLNVLKGISVEFRKSEFVAVLGQSGCGKTTLLNIIGGLDRYTSGNLIIEGVSTKDYTDYNWDAYRNHSIGFVFQSYNLIPHQTVLKNVELALTIAGVDKEECKKRAVAALEKVGLGDQLNKKPNQMSGGQMQRVAIARALINDPEIILADEPTGALDSTTSVQIMKLLKQISKDKLIIMVTHNPELAEKYANRTIRLHDGVITDDSNPYDSESEKGPEGGEEGEDKRKKYKVDMSFKTAFGLSLNNLLTKKGRTFLTAFAGSIGIIGIALILSLSSGFQNYISNIEESTLSSYPITIETQSADMQSEMTSLMDSRGGEHTKNKQSGKIYTNSIMSGMINGMLSGVHSNDLSSFKTYLDSDKSSIKKYANDIQYAYGSEMQIYKSDTSNGVVKVNPSPLLDEVGVKEMYAGTMFESTYNTYTNVWRQMIGDTKFIKSQYNVVAGSLPHAYNEVVMIINKYDEVSDYTLYTLGILDQSEFTSMVKKVMNGETNASLSASNQSFKYTDLVGLEFSVVPTGDFYKKVGGAYTDMSKNSAYVKGLVNNGIKLRIVGVVKAKEESVSAAEIGSVGYTSELTDYLLEENNKTAVVKAQLANKDVDVFTSQRFSSGKYNITQQNGSYYCNGEKLTTDNVIKYIKDYVPESQLPMLKNYLKKMSNTELQLVIPKVLEQYSSLVSTNTYDGNLQTLGAGEKNTPTQISIYAKDFASKEAITKEIDSYNKTVGDSGKIQYTDYVGMLLSNVSKIVDVVSDVLIAFVAISLVVSSIMIGIITYISVLERTKEIGILRAIGASKRDVSNVFNAETLIIGLSAGIIGILMTVLLDQPINWIIAHYTGIHGVASLPLYGAAALILISVFLTFIAGLIPARMASKKDPVIALRTE